MPLVRSPCVLGNESGEFIPTLVRPPGYIRGLATHFEYSIGGEAIQPLVFEPIVDAVPVAVEGIENRALSHQDGNRCFEIMYARVGWAPRVRHRLPHRFPCPGTVRLS